MPASPVRPEEVPIVFFGNDWNAENRTSSHHIARRLGQRFPLLYVEAPGLRRPGMRRGDLGKAVRKLVAALHPPSPIGSRMWRITLPQVPLRRWAAVRTFNAFAARILVGRALRQLRFRNPIAWFHVPHVAFLVPSLRPRLCVYYCIDHWAFLDPVHLAGMDAELTAKAHLVFAVSPALAEAKRSVRPDVIYSPHGVDVALFARAADRSLPLAAELRQATRPVVGYYGVLDVRVDRELLEFLAQARPRWTWLLIGRVTMDLGRLRSLPNVLLHGPVAYEDLPDWLRGFDVGILPYRQDAWWEKSNPLKMRELLAAGLPVVSVPSAEVQQLGDLVVTASTPEGFLEAIERALEQNSPELAARRMQAVAGMSWDARVEEILGHLRAKLDQTG